MTSTTQYTAAVIGVGNPKAPATTAGGFQIGYTHGQMYTRNERTHLVAAADINGENVRAFGERFNVNQLFDNHRTMLAEIRPDIVSVCTYVGLHRQMIEDAARAGVRGIICEKPFLQAPADLGAVEQVANETGVKIMVCHMRRYRPAFQRAREVYNDGTIGQPVLCVAGIDGWDLSEWGSHWLDMFRFFHNDQPVRWVMGQARVRERRGFGHAMEDHAVAYFEFENGGKGLVDGGKPIAGETTMTLVGTDGTIRVQGEHTLLIDTADGRRVESFQDHPRGQDWLPVWDALLADMIAWLDGGPEPMLGLTNMLKSAELNLAVYVSALRGDRIDLPLDRNLNDWPLEQIASRFVTIEHVP